MYVLHDVLWNLWHCFCLMRHFVFAWILSDGHGVVLQPACVSRVRVQCQLPGMARTCFPQRNSQKAFILKLWLFLCCSGHFGKCSGIQEETFRDVSPPPLLQKHVLCHFVKLLFFSPLLSFNVIYFSFSTHRSPRHVKHLPTMSWWVWTCACVCVCLCSTCVTLCTDETIAETFKDLVDLWNPLHNAMILPGIVAEPHTGSSVRLLLEVKGQML